MEEDEEEEGKEAAKWVNVWILDIVNIINAITYTLKCIAPANEQSK